MFTRLASAAPLGVQHFREQRPLLLPVGSDVLFWAQNSPGHSDQFPGHLLREVALIRPVGAETFLMHHRGDS